MKQLTAAAVLVTMLMATALAYAHEHAGKVFMAFHAIAASSRQATYSDFGRPGESMRVSGANDIYRVKISNMAATQSAAPIMGPYRSRSDSLFGSGFIEASLNPLTLRSENESRNASDERRSRPAWLHPAWRF
jgi:hypothetical protein